MKYRKKPVVVEALKWEIDNLDEMSTFIGDSRVWGYYAETNELRISTLEGVMTANEGDYIIKGVKGEFYPCKPDIFEMTYEKVEESENQSQNFAVLVSDHRTLQQNFDNLKDLYEAEKAKVANQDQKVGVDIIRRALQAPIRQIAENAGVDGALIVGKLLESTDTNYGYNAQLGEYTDMIKAGIIDPTKVVRTALQDAASVAGLVITTEAMVSEAPQKECGCGGHGAPAGGMGGMGF
jgi:hypothetical protein